MSIQTTEESMAATAEQSIEDMFAERDRLNERLTLRLSELRKDDIEWQKRTEFAILNRHMPAFLGVFLGRLRMFGIAHVFHDGRLEGGSSGLTLDEAITECVTSTFPESAGYSPKFHRELIHELQNVRIFDGSDGFDLFNGYAQASADAPSLDLISRLLERIALAQNQPGDWHHCNETSENAICAVLEPEHMRRSWRSRFFRRRAFLCHDMEPGNAALAVAAVNALPELIALAKDGLRYRARRRG